MPRKVYQGWANTLPRMVVGDRLFPDRETLAKLPDGTLTIDLLAGRASHTSAPEITLHITAELRQWLQDRAAEHRVLHADLTQAIVVLHIRTDRVATDKKFIVCFDLECESLLVSGREPYRGSAHNLVWHHRPT